MDVDANQFMQHYISCLLLLCSSQFLLVYYVSLSTFRHCGMEVIMEQLHIHYLAHLCLRSMIPNGFISNTSCLFLKIAKIHQNY